jgi:hypothetical protein
MSNQEQLEQQNNKNNKAMEQQPGLGDNRTTEQRMRQQTIHSNQSNRTTNNCSSLATGRNIMEQCWGTTTQQHNSNQQSRKQRAEQVET